MRGRCLLVVLVACSSPKREDVTVDAPLPTPDAYVDQVRPVTGVLVDSRGVTWTYGTDVCNHEGICWYGGPTATWYENAVDHTWIVDNSAAGAMTIAGDDHDAFIVTGTTHEERYVRRLRGGALSIPRPWTQGPALDGTYVYWAEQAAIGTPYTVRRASRAGDGSDGASLATVSSYVQQLVVYAGYVWLRNGSGTLMRVPTAGGASEDIASGITAMTVTPGGLVVARGGLAGNQPYAEVGIFDAMAAYRAVAQLPPPYEVRHLAADDRDIYLSNGSTNALTIYRVPVAGGSIETVATDVPHGYAIAITTDKLLYDFTPSGFKTIAR